MSSRNSFLDSPSYRRITPPSQRRKIERRRSRSRTGGSGSSSDPIRRLTEEEVRQNRLEQLQKDLSSSGTKLTPAESQAILSGKSVSAVRQQITQRQRKTALTNLQSDLSRTGTKLTKEQSQAILSGTPTSQIRSQIRTQQARQRDVQLARQRGQRQQAATVVTPTGVRITASPGFAKKVEREFGREGQSPEGGFSAPASFATPRTLAELEQRNRPSASFETQTRQQRFIEETRRKTANILFGGTQQSRRLQKARREQRGRTAGEAVQEFIQPAETFVSGSNIISRSAGAFTEQVVGKPAQTALLGTASFFGGSALGLGGGFIARAGATSAAGRAAISPSVAAAGRAAPTITGGALAADPEAVGRTAPFFAAGAAGATTGFRTIFPSERVIGFGAGSGKSTTATTRTASGTSASQEVPATIRVSRGFRGVRDVEVPAFVSTTVASRQPTRFTGARVTREGVTIRRSPTSRTTQEATIDQVGLVTLPSGRTQTFESSFRGFTVPSQGFTIGVSEPRGLLRRRDVLAATVTDSDTIATVQGIPSFRTKTEFATGTISPFGQRVTDRSGSVGVTELLSFRQPRLRGPQGTFEGPVLTSGQRRIAGRTTFRQVGSKEPSTTSIGEGLSDRLLFSGRRAQARSITKPQRTSPFSRSGVRGVGGEVAAAPATFRLARPSFIPKPLVGVSSAQSSLQTPRASPASDVRSLSGSRVRFEQSPLFESRADQFQASSQRQRTAQRQATLTSSRLLTQTPSPRTPRTPTPPTRPSPRTPFIPVVGVPDFDITPTISKSRESPVSSKQEFSFESSLLGIERGKKEKKKRATGFTGIEIRGI